MPGEYPSARRRSARRTRGRRAGAEHDLADPAYPASQGPDEFDGTGPRAAETELAQPAWSDAWDADSPKPSRSRGASGREDRYRGSRGQGETDGQDTAHTDDDPEARARQICLRQLSLAPKTRAQLKDAMRKRDIPDDVADSVLSRFTDVGLIDDAAFARAWVESRHYGKGLAGRALKAELRRRGVADDDIKDAVATIDPDSEAETARRLVERKLAGTRGQPQQVRTRRLAGMLARKGYPPGLAFRVIREALEAEGADGPFDEDSFTDAPEDCYEPYTE